MAFPIQEITEIISPYQNWFLIFVFHPGLQSSSLEQWITQENSIKVFCLEFKLQEHTCWGRWPDRGGSDNSSWNPKGLIYRTLCVRHTFSNSGDGSNREDFFSSEEFHWQARDPSHGMKRVVNEILRNTGTLKEATALMMVKSVGLRDIFKARI